MSRANKLRRQLKGYVRDRELESARREGYKDGHDKGSREGYYKGDAAGFKRCMDDRTLYVRVPEPDEYGQPRAFLLGEEPKRDHVVVPILRSEFRHRLARPFDSLDPREMAMVEQRIVFRARRQGFTLPNGSTVVWWDWEVRR